MENFYRELKESEEQKANNEEKKEEGIKKQLEKTSKMLGKKIAEMLMKDYGFANVNQAAKEIYEKLSEGIEEKLAEETEKKGQKDLQEKIKEE